MQSDFPTEDTDFSIYRGYIREGSTEIEFEEITGVVGKEKYKLLLRDPDGGVATITWSWIPHSEFARTKEDAVQIVRWVNMDGSGDPEAYGGEKGMKEFMTERKRMHDMAVQWLQERDQEIIEPWWREDLPRQIWY